MHQNIVHILYESEVKVFLSKCVFVIATQLTEMKSNMTMATNYIIQGRKFFAECEHSMNEITSSIWWMESILWTKFRILIVNIVCVMIPGE